MSNIKITPNGKELDEALTVFEENPLFFQFIKPLFSCREILSKLFSLEFDRNMTERAGEVVVTFKPAECLLELIVAVIAVDWKNFVVKHNELLNFLTESHPQLLSMNGDGTFTIESNKSVTRLIFAEDKPCTI